MWNVTHKVDPVILYVRTFECLNKFQACACLTWSHGEQFYSVLRLTHSRALPHCNNPHTHCAICSTLLDYKTCLK
jgi:hypothetical protein